MTLSEVTLESMPPLPLAPAGSLRVADGVAFGEDVDGNGQGCAEVDVVGL